MGTERTQPLTLICNYKNAKLYTVKADLSDLKILNIEVGLNWALFIAYNRGKMDSIKTTFTYHHFQSLANDCNMIIGPIANDRMFIVLDHFFRGDITDTALVHSLSALKLGKQYVATTEKACSQIKITEETILTAENRESLRVESEKNVHKASPWRMKYVKSTTVKAGSLMKS